MKIKSNVKNEKNFKTKIKFQIFNNAQKFGSKSEETK